MILTQEQWSAGQAFFGLGQFHYTTVPRWNYAVGKTTIYISYYILMIVPVVMLCCIPFAKKEIQEQNRKEKRNRNNK